MGVSSGSPVHIAGNPNARVFYLTEGGLKGNVAGYLMNRSFICTAGANNYVELDEVFAYIVSNGAELIVEAHDMDKYRNENIVKGASNAYSIARKHGLETRRLTWNPNYKGIDDWQLALKQESIKSGKEGKGMNFKERFIAGELSYSEFQHILSNWTPGLSNSQTRPYYLGLTEQEYSAFLRGENIEQMLLEQRVRQGFRIYQLEFTSDIKPKKFAFQGIEALRKEGYEQPPASEYRLVLDSEFPHIAGLSVEGVLKCLFKRYNSNLPDDYHGRCLERQMADRKAGFTSLAAICVALSEVDQLGR
jgi:hypothetical protein